MDIKPPKKRLLKVVKKNTQKVSENVSSQKLKAKLKPKSNVFNIKKIINNNSPSLRSYIVENKYNSLSILILFLAVGLIYFLNILKLPRFTLLDSTEALSVQSFTDLSSNVVFGPQKFIDYLLFKSGLDSVFTYRLASIAFVVTSVIIFFMLLKKWTGIRLASIATLLFASSSLVIAQARDSGYNEMFLLIVPTILATGLILRKFPASRWLYVVVFLIAVLCYAPAFIWLLAAAVLFYLPYIKNFAKTASRLRIASLILTFIIPVLPLVYFLGKNQETIKLWLGLTTDYQLSLSNVASNMINLPSQLFVSGLQNKLIWLNGTPIFDAATTVLAAAGIIYVFKDNKRSLRRLTLFSLLIYLIFLIGIFGSLYILALLPLLYIFAAFGLGHLLKKWFQIFPKNPYAQSVGFGLMTLLVVMISFYHVNRYFIVWPRSQQTIESFDELYSGTIDPRLKQDFYIK